MEEAERIDAGSPSLEKERQLALPQSWGIQISSLDFDEVSTAATVKKQNGSIFSSLETNRLLDDCGKKFDISIQGIPKWLQKVQFGRESVVLLRRLNRVKIPEFMQELDMFHLSGLASFVVFCCRYTEDSDTIKEMLQSLLMGELGNVVKIDRTFHDHIPYTAKSHIVAFIASHLDVDRNSSISAHVDEQISKLCEFGDTSIGTGNTFLRRTQESIDLMSELLGAAGAEGHSASSHEGQAKSDRHEGWARVRNTLYLTSAYIALAAQAHGAWVAVECVSSDGSRMFPNDVAATRRSSTFLLRLWLKQPPEYIRGILRHSQHSERIKGEALDDSDEEVIVFGGTLEIAKWVAKKLEFQCTPQDGTEHKEPLLELWNKGVQYGKTLRWVVRRRSSTDSFGVLLALERSGVEPPLIDPAVAPLTKLLQTRTRGRRLQTVARDIASVVHDLYQLDTHFLTPSSESEEEECMKAMYYVIMAVSIEALRSTIGPEGDSTSMYALNLATLSIKKGEPGNLYDLFCTALHEGIVPSELAKAAATVWGGAKVGLEADEQTSGPLLGVVTRQCAIIFDVIRDLPGQVRNFQLNRLLSIWRGAVPMLPRDPLTDYVYGGQNDRWAQPHEIGVDYVPRQVTPSRGLKGRLLITFEPFDRDPTRGVFCFWFGGSLLAEFAPNVILSALLAESESIQPMKAGLAVPGSTERPVRLVELSSADLLQIKRFKVARNVSVVVKGLEDAAWASFAFSCASIFPSNYPRLLKSDRQVLSYETTTEQVMIMVP
ncbi:hypothetical protein PG984_002637 [Apiospora sp. TS-2023a]